MKIAILSCFYPFRGGIAQFNANLFNELSASCDVKAFNFKRQYPGLLFPGKTQYVAKDDKAVSVESTPLLDTVNPFNWIRTARTIRKWKPDVLILRYWMAYFAPSFGYIARNVGKDCKVVAILDNVTPHEEHFFDKAFTKYFINGIHSCVTLCDEVARDLARFRTDIPHITLPHPVYNHFGERIGREQAEKELGLEAGKKNLLFFGLIRDYKGLDVLLRAFDNLDDSYQLILAGEPYGSFDKYSQIIDANRNKERIHLFLNYIPDDEVKRYFCAADVAVLPYRGATQSGISNIANHFELPMIVTNVGGLKETIGDRGTGLVCDFCSPACISDAIKEYFADPLKRDGYVGCIRKENENLSWNSFAENLVNFIENN